MFQVVGSRKTAENLKRIWDEVVRKDIITNAI